ncbi:hypothetical protein PAMP_016987 [Pampus punctatissimus]
MRERDSEADRRRARAETGEAELSPDLIGVTIDPVPINRKATLCTEQEVDSHTHSGLMQMKQLGEMTGQRKMSR